MPMQVGPNSIFPLPAGMSDSQIQALVAVNSGLTLGAEVDFQTLGSTKIGTTEADYGDMTPTRRSVLGITIGDDIDVVPEFTIGTNSPAYDNMGTLDLTSMDAAGKFVQANYTTGSVIAAGTSIYVNVTTIAEFTEPAGVPNLDGWNAKTVGTGKDYTTLAAWATYALAQSSAKQAAICYGGSNLGSCEMMQASASFTTSSTDYPIVTVATGQQHQMKWDTSKAYIDSGDGFSFKTDISFFRCYGLQMKANDTTYNYTAGFNRNDTADRGGFVVANLLIYAPDGNGTNGLIVVNRKADTTTTVFNVLAYNYLGRGISVLGNTGTTHNVYNCGAVECDTIGAGGIYLRPQTSGVTMTAKNCYAIPGVGGKGFYNDGFSGDIALYNCYSSDATADDYGGSGNVVNIATSGQFVDIDSDWALLPGSDFVDAGLDLSASFILDGANHIRTVPYTVGPWQDGDDYVPPAFIGNVQIQGVYQGT